MNRILKVSFGVYLFLILAIIGCGMPQIAIDELYCENSVSPVIENKTPRLRWLLKSDKRGNIQTAYRILVSDSKELLRKNIGNYWDSGKIYSSDTQVQYTGKALTSGIRLFWKVMVWDGEDFPSSWSPIQSWSMGLLEPSDWKAQWISNTEDIYPDSTLTYAAPYFRKEFSITKKIKRAVAYVCGLGFYEMYLNGYRVGDQVLAPAVTNYDTRSLKNLLYYYDDQSSSRVLYNVFDVTSLLSSNTNVIGMILGNGWYNQRDRIVEGHMWYDVPKMIMQLNIEYKDGTAESIISDQSWRTTTGPILHDAIFTGEVYDARLELTGWNKINYNDADWTSALIARSPTGHLCIQEVPYTKIMGTVSTHFIKESDTLYKYTLPETVAGWCQLRVKGQPGDTVTLRFISDEGLNYGQKDIYILSGKGEEIWEPRFTWHAFKSIEVISKKAELSENSIIVKSIYTDIPETGTFECSNELLNNIHQAFKRTMQANFKGIISSDPHRERLAYTGDGQVISESLLYTYDMTCFLKKFIQDISDASNKKTGYVPHTAPFGGGGGGPAWGSAYVIIPWNYYCHYGDTTLLQEHYEGMKHWIEYLTTRTDDNGIIVKEEPNGWCLGEWSTPHNIIEIPATLVNTAYFYHVTSIMEKVAGILHKDKDQIIFQSLASKIRNDFNVAFYNESEGCYWQGRQGSDVFALAFGLVPDGKYEKVFSSLLNNLEKINFHFDTGILATPLLLDVLTENGRADLAYKLMTQKDFPSYGYLADKKNNTLWETWNGDGNDEGCGHCHPMFGSVIAWFYRALGGIKPDTSFAGMKHFYIAPQFVESLKYCKTSYNSIYGRIVSDWEIDKNGINLIVEIPVNLSATVILPGSGNDTVSESGKVLSSHEMKKMTIGDSSVYMIKVTSGEYNFRVSGGNNN